MSRYIDADALIEKKWQVENESCFYALDDVVSVDDINDAPTIEPKRGEWIEIKGGWKCTACDKWASFASDFCPNCGADMRGDE